MDLSSQPLIILQLGITWKLEEKEHIIMGTEHFNRQFILLDFEDLDNQEFMEFVRSPEFSTYLIMRRYIWRSEKPHSLGLHE